MKMVCPNCGKEYNEKMTCCISCGADLVPCEHDREQTEFEPLIPESGERSEALPQLAEEKNGFVREMVGHSPVPPVSKVSAEIVTDTPLTVSQPRMSVSGAVRFAGSFIVSVMIFAFIVLFTAAMSVRLITDSENISRFAETLDVMNLPAADAAIPLDGYSVSEDATVQEAIYVMSQGTGLSREDIKVIYETSTMRGFLTSCLLEYAEFIRSGKIPEKITSDNLKSVFSENLGLIDSAIGKPLSQHDINLAFSEIDRVQPVLEKLSPASLENMLGEGGLAALRLLSSLPVIIGAAALAAAMFPLLRVINKKNSGMLRWGGCSVLIGGVAVLASMFIFTVQPFFGQDKLMRSITKCVAETVAPDLYRIGAALAVTGAVMLIWAGTLRKTERGQ